MFKLMMMGLGALALCCGQAVAQERAAGGAAETQMTWTALKSLVDTARIESKGAHDRIDQSIVCNKQFKVYAPDAKGAVNGCLDNKLVTDLRTDVTVVEGDVKNIIACNKKGQIYDGKACAVIKAEAERRWVATTSGKYQSKYSDETRAMNETIDAARAVYSPLSACSPASSMVVGRTCGDVLKHCYVLEKHMVDIGGQNNRMIFGGYTADIYSCR